MVQVSPQPSRYYSTRGTQLGSFTLGVTHNAAKLNTGLSRSAPSSMAKLLGGVLLIFFVLLRVGGGVLEGETPQRVLLLSHKLSPHFFSTGFDGGK